MSVAAALRGGRGRTHTFAALTNGLASAQEPGRWNSSAMQGHRSYLDDENLYCITCGYNLRGLGTDPRRCPECNAEYSVEELRLPADLVSRELWQLEVCPKWSVVGMWIAAAGVLPMVIGGSWNFCTGAVMVLGLVVWGVGALGFALACWFKRGWWRVLLTYYVVWTLVGGGVLACFWAVTTVQNRTLRSVLQLIGILAVLVTIIASAVTRSMRLSLPTIHWLDLPKRKLESFAREVAVMMVRHEMTARRQWAERVQEFRASGIPMTGGGTDVARVEPDETDDG